MIEIVINVNEKIKANIEMMRLRLRNTGFNTNKLPLESLLGVQLTAAGQDGNRRGQLDSNGVGIVRIGTDLNSAALASKINCSEYIYLPKHNLP
jgi:hypothetical protein